MSAAAGFRVQRRLAFFAILLVAVAGCAYMLVHGGRVDQSNADKIETRLQNIRELRFKSEVPVVAKTPSQVEEMVLADLARDYTDEQLDADGRAGAMVGLYPNGIDLKKETVKLLKNQIAGFYDPRGQQMVLVEGSYQIGFWPSTLQFVIRRDLVGEMLLAHELTHALQDENFDIDKKLDGLRDNGDAELALKSVAEGDATLAGFGCIMGAMNNQNADELSSRLESLPQSFAAQSKDTPAGLAEPLMFQYSDGVNFVAEAYKRGGWPAVDNLYRDPPESTQQIIEPALYFRNRTHPAQIKIDGWERAMPGWKRVDEDSYGQLSLHVILERAFAKDAPEIALARKWSGDKMLILHRGDEVALIWMIVLIDEPSAQSFARAYGPKLHEFAGKDVPVVLDVKSEAVLVVGGVGNVNEVMREVWKSSTIRRATPAPIATRRAASGVRSDHSFATASRTFSSISRSPR